MNKEIYDKIHFYNEQYNAAVKNDTDTTSALTNLENFLLRQAHKDPKNNELWFQLIAVQYHPPLKIAEDIDFYAQKILENDSECVEGLVLKLYSQWAFACINSEQVQRLIEIKSKRGPEKEGMACYILGLFFEYDYEDIDQGKKYYKDAIRLAPHFAHPYFNLANLYVRHYEDRLEAARDLMVQGIKNVKPRVWGHYFVDLTNIDDIFDEYIKGILIDQSELVGIRGRLEAMEQRIKKTNGIE